MPTLTLSDFEFRQATCEIRYAEAPLIFDRTGEIFHHLGKRFTNLRNELGTPIQTQMTADEGVFNIQMTAARLTASKLDASLEKFASHCKLFFDFLADRLDIAVFTRIGLRLIYIKPYGSSDEPKAALNALKSLGIKVEPRFGVGSEITEWVARWESKELGATLRLKAENGTLDAQFNPDLGLGQTSVHKEYHHLIADVDYYTLAIVERSQWDPVNWITRTGRNVRKEIDRVLST